MSKQKRPITEEQLNAYLDGQLEVDSLESVEAWLAENPAESARLRQMQVLDRLLKAEHQQVLEEPVPSGLTTLKPLRQSPTFSLPMFAAASLACLCIGGITGWMFHSSAGVKPTLATTLVKPAMMAHVTYTPEVVHPVEVRADQEAHLLKWLTKRLGQGVKAPSLLEFGYGLVGGRLLPGENNPAAQFMYENASGKRLTLYLRTNVNKVSDTSFQYAIRDNVSTFYWIDGDLGYALSGTMSKALLLDLAAAVYKELES